MRAFLLRLACAALLGLATPWAWAATVSVQPGQDLQAAITAAAPGDVVEVQRGHYRTNLLIDKPLTLRGLGRPTVDGGLQGDTIRVTAPDVVIEGLIVRDSGTTSGAVTRMVSPTCPPLSVGRPTPRSVSALSMRRFTR